MFLCIDTYIITGNTNACTHTYTHSVDREMYLFFLFIYEIYFILVSKNIFLIYSLPTADNKSSILKEIADDSFSAVIIECFL